MNINKSKCCLNISYLLFLICFIILSSSPLTYAQVGIAPSNFPSSFSTFSVPSFGATSFGTPSFGGSFGAPSFGGSFGTPSFGGSFGAPSFGGSFGAPSFGGAFGTPSFGGSFGAPSFGGSFGTPSFGGSFGTPSFGGSFGTSSFGTPSFGNTGFSMPNFGGGFNTSNIGSSNFGLTGYGTSPFGATGSGMPTGFGATAGGFGFGSPMGFGAPAGGFGFGAPMGFGAPLGAFGLGAPMGFGAPVGGFGFPGGYGGYNPYGYQQSSGRSSSSNSRSEPDYETGFYTENELPNIKGHWSGSWQAFKTDNEGVVTDPNGIIIIEDEGELAIHIKSQKPRGGKTAGTIEIIGWDIDEYQDWEGESEKIELTGWLDEYNGWFNAHYFYFTGSELKSDYSNLISDFLWNFYNLEVNASETGIYGQIVVRGKIGTEDYVLIGKFQIGKYDPAE